MSTATQTLPLATAKVSAQRYASVDILRGLTMVVMIFVNDLCSVRGLPWWNYHMKANVNFMTYVDMVYPFFLFVVGLSIPLAFRQRLKNKPSLSLLWLHVLVRSLSLIVLGLILANAEKGDSVRMGIDSNAWAILALAGAVLFLSVYDGSENYSSLHFWLRMFGLGLTIAMLAIFRRTADGHAAWIDTSYPEILGLIGYTYLAVSILYIPTRRWLPAPFGWFLALLVFNVFCTAKGSAFMRHVPLYFWPFGNGAMSSITMAGVVTSVILLVDREHQTLHRRILTAAGFGVATLIAGWFLTPLGISKIRATPTWSLYSIGAAVLLMTALYWICDTKKHTAWAFFARPAGANTLLTYLLPDFYYFMIAFAGVSYFDRHLNAGWPGFLRSATFTALTLAVAAWLTKLRLRLQL